ncbi:MAG: RC-LH1 core complex protein PufX [Sulfitobacter sp.]
MSDNNADYLRTGDRSFRLRADVFMLMMKGAGYAAIFCIVIGVFLAVTIWVGKALPPESKEAPDPSLSYVLPADPTAHA